MTASAFEQAKGKLCPEIFEEILRRYNKTMDKPKTMDGYRVFAIDVSDFNVPYSPLSEYVIDTPNGRPKKDGTSAKPCCLVHANLLYDIENRTYQECILQPKTKLDERSAAIDILKNLNVGKYIVIMDRGYEGFNMIETCNRLDNCSYIIRVKTGSGGIKEIYNLPDKKCDIDLSFKITTSNRYYMLNKDKEVLHYINSPKKSHKKNLSTKYSKWDFGQFCNIKCRAVKFRINDEGSDKEEWEVLITNLDRNEFPVSRMKEMYHKRWDIETSFRELKYALGCVNFHSKKDDFIKMELFAHLIMFNAVSRNIAQVNVPQADRKHPYAVDFKMACFITRKYYRLHNTEPPDKIFTEILAYTNPVRFGRSDKRNIIPKSAVWFVYRVA